MMMELTYDAAGTVIRRFPVTTRVNERPSHAPRVFPRPADNEPEFGRGMGPAQGWRAANRGLQRIEDVFAAAVCVGLLALGTLTFGYAFDGLTAAHAAVPAVAASK